MTDFLDYEGLSRFKEDLDGSINDYTTGINLLRGTRDFDSYKELYSFNNNIPLDGTKLSGNSFSKYTDEFGFTCIRLQVASDILWVNAVKGLKARDIITISCELMIEDVDVTLGGNAGTIYEYKDGSNLKTTYFQLKTLGIDVDKIEANKWYKVKYVYTVANDNDIVAFNFRDWSGRGWHMNIRKVKVEIGHINNPIWSASPFDVAQVSDTLTNANIATPSETLAYVKGSTGSAVTTLPNDGIFIGELPNATPEEGNSTSTLPSEDRPLVGLLKPEQDPDEIEGDDKLWQMM